MSNVIYPMFPSGPGDGGPEDPMIEVRLKALEGRTERLELASQRLEVLCSRIEETVAQLPKASDISALKAEVAEVRGRISMLPTWWMLLVAMIATWGAGAALVKFGLK